MAANSLPRRAIKRLLAPLLNDASYSLLQAVAMGYDIRSRGWWEPELELAARVLKEGDTAVDIGANYGLWAYYMSRAVGRGGKVYSFEPIPFTARTFALIARGLSFRHNTTLVAKGCGEEAGSVEFALPLQPNGSFSAGLVHMSGRNDERPGKELHAAMDGIRKVTCEIVRLDDYLRDVERLTLLKCDIEGADLYAMRGARGLLVKHKPVVVIEITPWFLEGFGMKVADVYDFFRELGYECFHYEDGGALVRTAVDAIVEDNWVFVHPANDARVRSLFAPAA